ncbi:hypothetical protein BDV28DRAFT_142549 [Aspergillus coremiiformis]|uniref:Uncharacterized protein n=1 Tax=Aspergillus coremiiformis TaxID=138285 RepID=A0A5N6YUT4_9EURO|nr:hypothetical protein BDV28DRAFT_142549 [Aspergillus coremiiformis]
MNTIMSSMDNPTAVNKNIMALESSAHVPVDTTDNTDDRETQFSVSQHSETDIYERLKSYPFSTDREFAKGLAIILGHRDTPATETEIGRSDDLVLQAKCFYFSRREKLAHPVNSATYKAWLDSTLPVNSLSGNETIGTTSLNTSRADTPPSIELTNQKSTPVQDREPSYPSSFAHIVELITTGQPIHGIQQIPDTILAGHDTLSMKPKRRKPWEQEKASETATRPTEGGEYNSRFS